VYLELRRGQHRILELAGLGTAGYHWEFELRGDPLVARVAIELGPALDPGTSPPGTSVSEFARVEGVMPGTVTIRLLQRRSWEPLDKFIAEEIVDLVVTE